MQLTVPLTNPEEQQTRERSGKMMLWLTMISLTMVFAALTSAYIVRQSDGEWVQFELPSGFWYSTVVLLLSSATMWFAVRSARKDNYAGTVSGVSLSLLLGLAFVFLQFGAWSQLVDAGIFFTGTNSASGSYLYFLTGLHLAHLFVGIIVLIVTTARAASGAYGSARVHGLRMAATFWHFLDFLWIYLFLFLLFIR